MNWYFINSGLQTGQYNMNFDIELARSCSLNEAHFRLYRWKPYCISLGANQDESEINSAKAEKDGIDIVRRPTGGRAILHAEEITYSVVLHLQNNFSPREIYSKISVALARGLSFYDSKLREVELESIQPDFPSLLKQPSGMLCFASTAKNELKYRGKKIVGSAQRKIGEVILQHGSILCGKFHRQLPDYLVESEENRKILVNEMNEKTTEIESIIEKETDYNKLTQCLVDGFSDEWNIILKEMKKV